MLHSCSPIGSTFPCPSGTILFQGLCALITAATVPLDEYRCHAFKHAEDHTVEISTALQRMLENTWYVDTWHPEVPWTSHVKLNPQHLTQKGDVDCTTEQQPIYQAAWRHSDTQLELLSFCQPESSWPCVRWLLAVALGRNRNPLLYCYKPPDAVVPVARSHHDAALVLSHGPW